jgi:hypothetical protein
MIYGDWEKGYEQLLAMFNAMKAANPAMHYEYIPKPNEWNDGRQIFFHAFWCFPQCVEAFRYCCPVLSIDGTFLLGKYMGTLLVAISCDADNALVPLAFALVERENKDSWGWFLRLIIDMSLALIERLVPYLIDTRAYSVPYRRRFWGMHLCTTVGALSTLPRIYFRRMVRRTTFLYLRRLLACLRCRSSRSWSS